MSIHLHWAWHDTLENELSNHLISTICKSSDATTMAKEAVLLHDAHTCDVMHKWASATIRKCYYFWFVYYMISDALTMFVDFVYIIGTYWIKKSFDKYYSCTQIIILLFSKNCQRKKTTLLKTSWRNVYGNPVKLMTETIKCHPLLSSPRAILNNIQYFNTTVI